MRQDQSGAELPDGDLHDAVARLAHAVGVGTGGCVSPTPRAVIRSRGTPARASASLTALARRSESRWLYVSGPERSALPTRLDPGSGSARDALRNLIDDLLRLRREVGAVPFEVDAVLAGARCGGGTELPFELVHRGEELAAAGGDVIDLPVLRLLLEPAIVAALRPRGEERGTVPAAAVERGEEALAGAGELALLRRRDRSERDVVRRRGPAARRHEALAREVVRVGPIPPLRLVFAELEVLARQRRRNVVAWAGTARLS